MSSPYAHGPAPTASVIPMGGDALRQSVKGGLGCLFIALIFIGSGLMGLLGANGKPHAGGYAAIALGLVPVALGALLFRTTWKARHSSISVDQVGLWIRNPAGGKVIPWDSLAGVGLHWSKQSKSSSKKVYSVELCPNGPIDRDHPVLWNLVRDEEPLHPSLPRLRYRIPVGNKARDPLVTAIQQYAPQLWLGEVEREPNHIGYPDVKGHRQRTGRSR